MYSTSVCLKRFQSTMPKQRLLVRRSGEDRPIHRHNASVPETRSGLGFGNGTLTQGLRVDDFWLKNHTVCLARPVSVGERFWCLSKTRAGRVSNHTLCVLASSWPKVSNTNSREQSVVGMPTSILARFQQGFGRKEVDTTFQSSSLEEMRSTLPQTPIKCLCKVVHQVLLVALSDNGPVIITRLRQHPGIWLNKSPSSIQQDSNRGSNWALDLHPARFTVSQAQEHSWPNSPYSGSLISVR